VLLTSAYAFALPISSTHVMTTSIMGVGISRRATAVRWGVGQRIAAAWLLTLPGAAATAWVAYHAAHAIVSN
jgi:PiT family inorganic phosphate transporter